eukprot:1288208-Prymnesium_polylepis.2
MPTPPMPKLPPPMPIPPRLGAESTYICSASSPWKSLPSPMPSGGEWPEEVPPPLGPISGGSPASSASSCACKLSSE